MGADRTMRLLGLVLVVLVALAGCGGSQRYDGLTPEESAFVIPGSAGWGAGNPCKGGDCGGPASVASLAREDWVEIRSIEIVAGGGDGLQVSVEIETLRKLRDGLVLPSPLSAWGPDVPTVQDRLADGLTVWAARCHDTRGVLCRFVAFDDAGRFAALGFGAARFVTTPVAKELAAGSARTALDGLTAAFASR